MLLADLNQDRVVDEFTDMTGLRVQLVLVAKGRVVSDMDAFGLVPFGKVTLLQPWVSFKLVYSGLDRGVLHKTLHFGLVEVGDTNGTCFTRGGQFLHRSPCLGECQTPIISIAGFRLG